MKKQSKRLISMLLLLAFAAALFSGCSSSAGSEKPGQDDPGNSVAETGTNTVAGSVLNVVANQDMPTLHPLKNSSQCGYTLSYNIYEGLLYAYKGDWNDIRGCLAETWDVSDDGMEWVFHLRKGVKFHDGSDFDSADVLASFQQLEADQPSFFASIESYEAVDEYTFAVHMNQPYAYFRNVLCSIWFKIMSAEAIEAYESSDIRIAVGTGPYYVDSYETGDKVVTKAFQDYWNEDDIPYIETVNYVIITDSNTAFMALQSGEVDYLPYASTLQYTMAASDSKLATYQFENSCNWILGINTTVAPLDKLEVRQAIDMCIDKDAVNMAGFDGLGFATNSTYVEESGVYADMGHTYDPEGAVALLASVGIEPADIKLTLKCPTEQKAMAENIQSQLTAVGMSIEVITLDFGVLNETRVTGDFELNLYDTGGNLYNPLGSITQMALSSGVVCTSQFIVTDPAFQEETDSMIGDALAATTPEEATALGQKVMEHYQARIPWIPMVGSYIYHIADKNVSDVIIDTFIAGYPVFQYAKIS